MITETRERIERVSYQIQQITLRAQLAIVKVQIGEYKLHNIYDGNGRELTDEEKLYDAIRTANRHIEMLEEFSESKIELMKRGDI